LKASGSREQKHACADDDDSNGSRDALAGWSEPLGSDGCRHDGHDAQVHDAHDQQNRRQAGAAVAAVEAEAHAVSPGGAGVRWQPPAPLGRLSAGIGTSDGSIIATIITIHMPSNEAAAPAHVCPGIRIHAIDIVQPPGISIPPIADMGGTRQSSTSRWRQTAAKRPQEPRAQRFAQNPCVAKSTAQQSSPVRPPCVACAVVVRSGRSHAAPSRIVLAPLDGAMGVTSVAGFGMGGRP
jgi:hypothetical protein